MFRVLSSEDDSERTPLLLAGNGEIDASVVGFANAINVSPDELISSEASSASTIDQSAEKGKQNSFFTVFALWNAMMGTSILTMPWAIEQAGLTLGIICMVFIMGLCWYTALRVIQLPSLVGVDMEVAEFTDLCGDLLQYGSKWIALGFSLIALVGAIIVYWILMSNFLYNIVTFIYFRATNSSWAIVTNSNHSDVYCPVIVPANTNHTTVDHMNFLFVQHQHETFEQVWNLNTVPIFLVLIAMLLTNYKSLVVFTKLNGLGLVSVIFLTIFVSVKAHNWGINVDWHNKLEWDYIPQYNSNFPALTGTLTLAFFIHNCVLAIIKNQKNPKNNVRDLSLAFVFVCITYLIVGVVFYISFPLHKLCIEDNLLNNFHNSDMLTFAARICLLIQFSVALPLIMFVIRKQILHEIFPHKPHQYRHIIPINIALITIGVIFAIFYPHISFLIRYTGALCGLVYTFALPCLTYLKAMQRRGQLTKFNVVFHFSLIVLGAVNLAAQFFVSQRY